MQSDKRGRAGGVDRQARSPQIEHVGDAIGQDAERVPSHEIGIGPRRIPEPQIGIIGGGCSDIDPCGSAGKLAGRDAGILDRVGQGAAEIVVVGVQLEYDDLMPRAMGEVIDGVHIALERFNGGRCIWAFGPQMDIEPDLAPFCFGQFKTLLVSGKGFDA